MAKTTYIQLKVHQSTKDEFCKRLRQRRIPTIIAGISKAVEKEFDISLLDEYSNDSLTK